MTQRKSQILSHKLWLIMRSNEFFQGPICFPAIENNQNHSDKKSILRNKSQFCCGYLKGRGIEILYKYFLISRRFGVITSYARKIGLATMACELKVANSEFHWVKNMSSKILGHA